MTKQTKREGGFSEEFFNVYHRVPDRVKKYTDPLVKTGLKTERKLRPQLDKGKRDADMWIYKHYTSKVKKVIGLTNKIKYKI